MNGLRHGQGKLIIRKTNQTVEGRWEDDKQTQDVELRFDGNKYVGDLQDGQPHGRGEMTYSNGDTYKGSFVNGKRSGDGRLTHA